MPLSMQAGRGWVTALWVCCGFIGGSVPGVRVDRVVVVSLTCVILLFRVFYIVLTLGLCVYLQNGGGRVWGLQF